MSISRAMETFTEPWQARENTFFLSLDGSCNINRYVLDLVYNDTAEPTLLLRPFFNDSQRLHFAANRARKGPEKEESCK